MVATIVLALCVMLTSQAHAKVVTGRVFDEGTGRPVAGARVIAVPSLIETVSDDTGKYRLVVRATDFQISASSGRLSDCVTLPIECDVLRHDFHLSIPRIVSHGGGEDWFDDAPRTSTSAAVRLIMEMDAQRQRDALMRLLDDLCRPAPDFEGLPHRKSLGSCCETDGESRWSVSKRDTGSAGWEHVLGRIPGIVVR